MRRFLLALLALACAAGAKTFTLEQVLSAPFPSELIASPDGNRVAWMLNERGARNVWVASAPDWKGVRATSYTADDGQDVGQLQWTPDSRSVVYVHGGDLEFLGRPDPNPAMNPAGVEQAIWLVTPGQAPRKIAMGHSPAVSPKGDRIVFLLGGQVWTAPLHGTGGARHAHPCAHRRHRVGTRVVARRSQGGLRQRPHQPQLHRDLRFHRQIPGIPRPQHRPATATPSGRPAAARSPSSATSRAVPPDAARTAQATPGRSASPAWRTAPAGRSGRPSRAPVAFSTLWSRSSSSTGAPATAFSSRGSTTDGCTSTP